MHIVIFTMSLNKGGAERVITNLCNEYLIRENQVTIITCMKSTPQYNLNNKISHLCLDEYADEQRQNKIKRFLRRRKRLKELFKSLDIDVILNILPEPSFLALSLKHKTNVPMIVSVRSDPAMEYTFLPYKVMMRLLYPRAQGFIMQTEEAKNYFPNVIRTKAIVIPNPINKNAVKNSFQGERKKEIVAVGRLTMEKNYPLLLKAYKEVNQKYPEYKLIIYGEGPLRKELENNIEQLGLIGKAILAGQKDDIYEKIYESQMFVMSSSHEGMPNALMEAMALGIPVIATDCPCGGPRFLICNEENGLLVENNSEEALASAICRFLEDKPFAQRMGQRANEIVDKLEPNKIYEEWWQYILYIKNGEREDG